MFLYLSTSTSYSIYNDLFKRDMVAGGHQSQRFNYNIISGLSKFTNIAAVTAFPYKNINAPKIEKDEGSVKYICIKNIKGLFHKFHNTKKLIVEGKNIIKNNNVNYIICDSFSLSPAIAAKYLSKKFNIPAVAIVTDIHEAYCEGKMSFLQRIHSCLMKKFDLYVLLTEQMKELINPRKKPFVVMEGSSDSDYVNIVSNKSETDKRICIYSGVLWKEKAGLEYLIDGFLKANIPNTELHFYGSGELKKYIIETSILHPQIKYMGYITNHELVIKQQEASLLINPRPSSYNFCKYSFPSKTFEYMVSGTPVLMTKLPGISKEYFKYVYTIDKENADGISEKLIEIFSFSELERKNKANAARKFISTQKNNIVQSKKIYDFLMSQ